MDFSKFHIIWIESCTYPGKTGINKHKHGFFHFLYTDSGTADATIGENCHTMTPGNLYLVSPETEHSFFNNESSMLKTLEIKFSVEDTETEKMLKELPFCMNVKNYPVKSSLLTIYKESLKKQPMFQEVSEYQFRLLLTYLMRCFQDSQNNIVIEETVQSCSPEIHKVLSFINENLGEEISLEKLADIAGFEKNYFLRKFKRLTHQTPMMFLKEARIEKAKELLCYSDMNISQIAVATGFQTIHYFSNTFLKSTGMRPLEYREENGVM